MKTRFHPQHCKQKNRRKGEGGREGGRRKEEGREKEGRREEGKPLPSLMSYPGFLGTPLPYLSSLNATTPNPFSDHQGCPWEAGPV
jgi:hypothetical protein